MNNGWVWVVTYIGDDGIPVVTVWENKKSAVLHYGYEKKSHNIVTIDFCKVFTTITLREEDEKV